VFDVQSRKMVHRLEGYLMCCVITVMLHVMIPIWMTPWGTCLMNSPFRHTITCITLMYIWQVLTSWLSDGIIFISISGNTKLAESSKRLMSRRGKSLCILK
jgi:hypothetical protein